MAESLDLDELFSDLHHDDVREKLVKTPLNYMGCKTDTLDQILKHLPYRNKFVDVFGGSGAVTIARRPSKLDVFNDRHSGVSAFFTAIKTDYSTLYEHIQTMPHSREMFKWCQDNVEKTIHDITLRGAMWYYIVQTSFAGRGAYWGRVTQAVSPVYRKIGSNLDLFFPLSERFSRVQVENMDWRQVLQDYDSEDTVFYLDPPYYNSNVYQYNMTKDEHREMCHKIKNLKGFVALSGFANDIYDSFTWDERHAFTLRQRTMSAATSVGATMENHGHTIDRTSERVEYLWIKK